MCHSRGLNNRINNLHERALRIVFQDQKSDFKTLLKIGKSVTIHARNLHYPVTEIYEVKNNISPEIMRDIFHFQENENWEWYPSCFKKHENNTVWEKDGIKLKSQYMVAIARGT